MENEELSFFVDNGFGQEVECKIISMVKNSEDELLVLFLDDEKDEKGNQIFKYGKLINDGEDYTLEICKNKEELEIIKKQFEKDIIEISKEILNNV